MNGWKCGKCGKPEHPGGCRPKKAQTKTKEHIHAPTKSKKDKETDRHLQCFLDVAIERGERLEKITDIMNVAQQETNSDDGSVTLSPNQVRKIYKLAKGA